jgi:hypothetical protein
LTTLQWETLKSLFNASDAGFPAVMIKSSQFDNRKCARSSRGYGNTNTSVGHRLAFLRDKREERVMRYSTCQRSQNLAQDAKRMINMKPEMQFLIGSDITISCLVGCVEGARRTLALSSVGARRIPWKYWHWKAVNRTAVC